MGRLIEIDMDKLKELLNDNKIELTNNIISIVRENYIPKDEYETRLKADLAAILTDLQLEIEELDSRAGYNGGGMPTFSTDYIRKKKVNELIQQKINSLKENTDVC